MRARGRCTPPIALIILACAPLSIIGQHAKGIGAIEGVEHPRARTHVCAQRRAHARTRVRTRARMRVHRLTCARADVALQYSPNTIIIAKSCQSP